MFLDTSADFGQMESYVGRAKPPGPVGACHRAGPPGPAFGRPDDRLRAPTRMVRRGHASLCPPYEAVKQIQPHPEEARSAVSKDGSESVPCRHPSRRARERAPQDEVANVSQALRCRKSREQVAPAAAADVQVGTHAAMSVEKYMKKLCTACAVNA